MTGIAAGAEPTEGARRRIVVGVDGSPDSVAALRAGERAAAAQGGELVAVAAYGAPRVAARPPQVLRDLHDVAAALLAEALMDAFDGRCAVPVTPVVERGGAAAVLVDRSRGADLLVVGSRGHGGFAGLLVGSVSMACSMHAPCPVLVLHRQARAAASGGGVVAGVGGGRAAAVVLRVAARAAEEMDAELLAIGAWEDTLPYAGAYADFRIELEAAARRELDGAVADAFAAAPPPRLRSAIRNGSAARVLVEASASADLVVVGRGGRSELAAVLLGAVALPVAEHAACPVLVVPAADAPGATGLGEA